jgi:hypothetical protein
MTVRGVARLIGEDRIAPVCTTTGRRHTSTRLVKQGGRIGYPDWLGGAERSRRLALGDIEFNRSLPGSVSPVANSRPGRAQLCDGLA